MAAVVSIPQNLFYIIIAVIAVVGLIVALMQWRRVREGQSNVMFLEKQAELRKIELVEKDIESKRIQENIIPLPKEQQDRLSEIRKTTTELMHRSGYLHSEINERVTRLEARTEYLKLQKLLQDIEGKEKELDKKTKKSGKSADEGTKKSGKSVDDETKKSGKPVDEGTKKSGKSVDERTKKSGKTENVSPLSKLRGRFKR